MKGKEEAIKRRYGLKDVKIYALALRYEWKQAKGIDHSAISLLITKVYSNLLRYFTEDGNNRNTAFYVVGVIMKILNISMIDS